MAVKEGFNGDFNWEAGGVVDYMISESALLISGTIWSCETRLGSNLLFQRVSRL